MTGRQTTDQTTQEQLTAIAAAEMAKVEWSSYERMLLQYLRGDKESAWVFLNDLYVVVCKKRAALIDLESELFPYKSYNPDRKEAKK